MSSRPSSFTCHLCPAGADPIHPDKVLSMGGGATYTCSEMASLLLQMDSAENCLQVQFGGASTACCDDDLDWTCDPYNDPCPYAADSICMNFSSGDDDYSYGGNGSSSSSAGTVLDPTHLCLGISSDCIDCDPCAAYSHTRCDLCTFSDGCSWCPGDGTCTSTPYVHNSKLYPPPLVTIPPRSCTSAEMWQLSCSEAADDGPVFNDPRYGDNSWAFRLINVESVWRQGITGSGVHIRINDEGLDSSVVDLAGKFDLEGSCESYLPSSSEDMHGTACASIAAAAANNGECTVGIAPGATISSCKVYGRGIEDGLQHPDFLLYTLDRQDVSSNSFGIQSCVSNNNEEASDLTRHGRPEREIQQSSTASSQCPFLPGPDYPPCSACGGAVLGVGANEDPLDAACVASIVAYCSDFFAYEADADACVQHLELFATCHYNALAPSYQTVLTKAIREGRNGKGLIVVFAAGNEYGVGGDANMDGILSSRLTISVGAVGKNGRHALYSTPGSCLFVSAPGGDVESQTNWVVAKPGGGCTDVTSTGASLQGTSLAAPVVAGVVALMLEVNPLLTWRDVQGILARTSQRVYDPNGSADSLATTNAAGYWHSYLYGFGIVDAAAAVRAASNWTNFGQERMVSGSSGQVNLTIDDSGTVVNSTVLIRTGGRTMTVESVVVYLDVETSSRGHLEIRLYSPAGTESILAPGMRPTSAQVPKSSRWKLMTVRNWGESTRGLWTLSVADTKPGDYSSSNRTSGCVDNAYDDDDYYYYLVQDCAALEKNVGLKACDEMPKARLACCFCGGGQAVVATRDHLESWTIVVYGRDGSASASDEEAFPPIANPESSASSPIPSALRSPAPTFRQRSNADPPSFTLTVDSPLPEVRLPPKGQDGDGASTSIVSDGDDDSRSTPSSSATTRYSNWFLRRRGARRLSNLLLMTC